MKAEIIAVGSELLTPTAIDTNSLHITEQLNDIGFEVHLKTVVGDRLEDITSVLRSAMTRSKLIVFSGGLGPTEDDLTRPAVAAVLGRPLRTDEALLENLRRRFARHGYRMPKNNERQAEIIQGAAILENAFGTAPGMWLEERGVCIALLPGPPRELQPMLETGVLPRVRQISAGRRLSRRSFHVTGMTESAVDSRIAPLYKAYEHVQTTILSSAGHIGIHLRRWRDGEDEPFDIEELAAAIRSALGSAIFTESGESLEAVVGDMLREAGLTLAVAESCTAGLVGSHITRIPGSSEYFLGGVLCYSDEVKRRLCGVPEEVLERHGAVSPETAEALAAGVRGKLGSSIGLAITGIAGPGGGSEEKPVGLVYVGLSDEARTIHLRRIIPGDRETIRERTTYFALSALRKFLMTPAAAETSP